MRDVLFKRYGSGVDGIINSYHHSDLFDFIRYALESTLEEDLKDQWMHTQTELSFNAFKDKVKFKRSEPTKDHDKEARELELSKEREQKILDVADRFIQNVGGAD